MQTQLFTGSKKIYISGQQYPFLRVPMREIQLSNQQKFAVYDTSGISQYRERMECRQRFTGITQTMVAIEKASHHAIILCETGDYYPGNGIRRHSGKSKFGCESPHHA